MVFFTMLFVNTNVVETRRESATSVVNNISKMKDFLWREPSDESQWKNHFLTFEKRSLFRICIIQRS